jgi:uncharacterized protein (TIGR03083 family)
MLVLRTEGACDFDPEHLLDVFSKQRLRFVAILQGFGPDDWAGPTRCADWSAHDVVRHLCDCNAIPAAAVTDDEMLVVAAGYDPRITPRGWLTSSANESTGATFDRFLATSEQALALARAQLARNRGLGVRLPYGPMDWTVLMLHGLWDSWIHERDVLLRRAIEHPTDGDATFYVTAYGLFLAAAVASMFGDRVQEQLKLGGDGGGVFDLDSRDGVTLRVNRVATAGPPAAEVADALAGRSPVAAALGHLPASSRVALSRMGDFFNTPVGPGPA